MMSAAAAAPIELPSAAGPARLAGELALSGSERRSDAATAALLAAVVGSSAAIFVADDLRGSLADPRVGQARGRKRRGGHRRAVHRGLRGTDTRREK